MQTPAHNYDPPMALRGVETVINPMADPDTISHTYHEPSEMNAACARALPHPPTSTTVMNLHYGVGMGSQSFGSLGRPVGGMEPPPQYQDPDELESVSSFCQIICLKSSEVLRSQTCNESLLRGGYFSVQISTTYFWTVYNTPGYRQCIIQ